MAGQHSGLRPPQPGDAAHAPDTGRSGPLSRVCDTSRPQPWFFSSRDTAADPGRFDLTSADGGTCYWAAAEAAALLEATGDLDALDPPVIAAGDLANLTVWTATIPAASALLADTTVASHRRLTTEISTTTPYDVPWAWADAFHHEGRTGICYVGRFAHDDCVAVFGPHGVPDNPPAATATPAIDFYDHLPAGFTAGIDAIGRLNDYTVGQPPV